MDCLWIERAKIAWYAAKFQNFAHQSVQAIRKRRVFKAIYPILSLSLAISPLELIAVHPGNARNITLYIKRDDLLHPVIEGSKGRKLLPVIPLLKNAYPGGLLSFGGAFSNHLHAVAMAGKTFGFPTIGILRGEYVDLQNPTLLSCQENGMRLIPMARGVYDQLVAQGTAGLKAQFPDCYILPEGGNTAEAVEACAQISSEIQHQLPRQAADQPLYICVPAGTGCTAAGVICGLRHPNAQVLIFPVSSYQFDAEKIRRLLPPEHVDKPFRLIDDYCFGGFAKLHPPVVQFASDFLQQTNILLDPIYTAKMTFGVFEMLAKNAFAPHSVVVLLHTGGMQGWKGFSARYGAVGNLST